MQPKRSFSPCSRLSIMQSVCKLSNFYMKTTEWCCRWTAAQSTLKRISDAVEIGRSPIRDHSAAFQKVFGLIDKTTYMRTQLIFNQNYFYPAIFRSGLCFFLVFSLLPVGAPPLPTIGGVLFLYSTCFGYLAIAGAGWYSHQHRNAAHIIRRGRDEGWTRHRVWFMMQPAFVCHSINGFWKRLMGWNIKYILLT